MFVPVRDLLHVICGAICAFEISLSSTEITPEGVARVADDSHTFYEVHRCSIFYSLGFYVNRIHSVLDMCTRLCEKHFSINYVSAYSRIVFVQSLPSPLLLLMRISLHWILTVCPCPCWHFGKKSVLLWCFPPTALISQGQVPFCYSSAGASVPSEIITGISNNQK